MVRTRHQRRRRPGSATRRSYRRRVRTSQCRGAGPAACRGRKGCKYASGRKRSYCRRTKNTRRRRQSGGSGLMAQVRRALVPYALYHTQKTHQRGKRHHRRRRRRRRRR